MNEGEYKMNDKLLKRLEDLERAYHENETNLKNKMVEAMQIIMDSDGIDANVRSAGFDEWYGKDKRVSLRLTVSGHEVSVDVKKEDDGFKLGLNWSCMGTTFDNDDLNYVDNVGKLAKLRRTTMPECVYARIKAIEDESVEWKQRQIEEIKNVSAEIEKEIEAEKNAKNNEYAEKYLKVGNEFLVSKTNKLNNGLYVNASRHYEYFKIVAEYKTDWVVIEGTDNYYGIDSNGKLITENIELNPDVKYKLDEFFSKRSYVKKVDLVAWLIRMLNVTGTESGYIGQRWCKYAYTKAVCGIPEIYSRQINVKILEDLK